MDPLTIGAVLVAIAGGAGEALGSQLWTGLSALVRRPFRRVAADAKRLDDFIGAEGEPFHSGIVDGELWRCQAIRTLRFHVSALC